MKKLYTLIATLALSMAAIGLVSAQTSHEHGTNTPEEGSSVTAEHQPGRQHDMMRMHEQMRGAGMADAGHKMDRDTMRMMMGGGMMGRPVKSAENADSIRKTALERLTEFDVDKDGTLSLAEFETLHSAMIRETTVDRFQHLDADGDGKVTQTEVAAPAERMKMFDMMKRGSGRMGMGRQKSDE